MLLALAQASAGELSRSCGSDPGLACRKVLDWTGSGDLAQIVRWGVGAPLRILLILVGAVVVSWLLRRMLKHGLRRLHSGTARERLRIARRGAPRAAPDGNVTSVRADKRIDALTSVLRGVVTFIVWVLAAFMILGQLGIDVAPLLAGAGVAGVALGIGAQSLVRDFLSGMFILVEDQFGVGDIVDLDKQTNGVVESVSLRTTRLRSVDGTVWHVPNGEIRRVGNMSQHWSRSLLDVEVAYDTDIEHAKRVVKRVADRLWEEDQAILEEPEMWGVEQLGAAAIVLRLVIKTTPSEQWRVARELRERLKLAFDGEGIEIPLPQQTVWHRGTAAVPATARGGS